MNKTGLRHPARLAGSSFLRLQSDERLAELAAAGHDAAFDAIVVRYRAALLRYCGAIVGSGRAEDAVQQTLINAHTALGEADEVRHLRSWLYRIAHNVSLNLLRTVRDDVSLDADGAEGLRLPTAASPGESFEASEQFRATVAALQALPERQRAALVLRELEGRSHEEIADALGVSAGSARQHLMRARVAMRGAVTAVTPWGLIVRIAELASAGGGGGGLETAASAGLGAGLAKVTAGVMATGALVGGAAVGTHEVVRHDGAAPAQADVVHTTRRSSPRRATTTADRTISLPAAARVTTTPSRSARSEAEHHHRGRGKGRGRDDRAGDDHRGRGGSGRHGSDDASRATTTPRADDHGRRGGRGSDDATERSANSGSRSGSRSGSGGHGSDDSATSHSRSGSGRSGTSGRSSGGSDDTVTAAPLAPAPSTSGSGDSGSGSGSGSGRSSDDAVLAPSTSGSTDSSGGSGSGSSGSGKSGDDSSSGSGTSSDD